MQPQPQQRSRPSTTPARAATLLACVLSLTSTLLIGCALPKAPPEITPGIAASPAISMHTRLARHLVVIECPSPGYTPHLDQLRDAPGRQHAFISLRQPNPAFIYPQTITRQEVATEVPASIPLTVFIRTLPFEANRDASLDDNLPYQEAASSQSTQPTPQATTPNSK